ncbi:hypothetical protein D9M68_871550 [compost metagenome]
MPLHQHAFVHQLLHRLAHGDARHVGTLRQVAFGGQGVAGVDKPALYGIFYPALELEVERATNRQHDRSLAKNIAGLFSHWCS